MANLHLTRHASPQAFLSRAQDWLMAAEAEHNLILGICERLINRPDHYQGQPYLATVEDGDSVVLAGAMTLPFKLVFTRAVVPEALGVLAEDLIESHLYPPGILAPATEAQVFARIWRALNGIETISTDDEGVSELRQVIHPEYSGGYLRPANAEERELLIRWRIAFMVDTGLHEDIEASKQATEDLLERGALYVWDDDGPVSVAATNRSTPHGVCIGMVYTPPPFRQHGYATSCVAALSQQILDSGREFCCLFTQLSNPTSTAIYERIGYRAVAKWSDIAFA
jgi:predicted GNAT family acetyltransferase